MPNPNEELPSPDKSQGKKSLFFFRKTYFIISTFFIHKVKKITYFSFLLLLAIAFMPWVSEATVNQQVYQEIKKYSEPLDPIKAGQMALMFSPYTPGIIEDPEDVTISLMIKNDNYTLAQQLALNANKNIAEPSRQEATYQVQAGETITQIAERFNLHVASILDANAINPEDSKNVKEGVILKIPSSDTSTSSDWLVAIKKAEDEARAKAAAEAAKKRLASSRALAAGTRKTSSGYSGVDNSGLIIPISHRGISQYFGRGHTGVDFMANVGTGIRASASGKVVIISSGWSGGYGNQIVIDHGGGRATRYAHLSSFNVSVGDTVSKGQTIARSGNTGRSTGPHLHWELIISGRPVNPL